MDLTHLFTLARSMELFDRQSTEIEKSERENANAIAKQRTPSLRRNKMHFMEKAKGSNKQQYRNQTCRNCGGEYPHKDWQCPTQRRQCNFCKKKTHFAKVCRSRLKAESKVNQVESQQEIGSQERGSTSDSSDEEYIFGLRTQIKEYVLAALVLVKLSPLYQTDLNMLAEGTPYLWEAGQVALNVDDVKSRRTSCGRDWSTGVEIGFDEIRGALVRTVDTGSNGG
ncbi:hypothetical protein CHS0354_036766 [Potamilus streckersoni]|uniref:CCHC-type domain-containing protein n=1 Tax=Potamilus streckersoni TaxID=2493646 RepID=A0AAE0S5K0_9BIVA|nr:hypothetical protein CHS0354_036766 [Potamilus streckersoni]